MAQNDSLTGKLDRIGIVIAKMVADGIAIPGRFSVARAHLADARACLAAGQRDDAMECAELAVLELGG